jgi:hypothetical protein
VVEDQDIVILQSVGAGRVQGNGFDHALEMYLSRALTFLASQTQKLLCFLCSNS